MDQKQILIRAQQYEAKQAAEKLALAQQLGTAPGFFQYYFESLPKFTTQTECFENANLLHYKIFRQYKYADYNSFRNQMAKYLKSKK